MYKLLPDTYMGPSTSVLRLTDNAFIPMDEANTDYQEYLKWLAEGNEPIAADAAQPADGGQ